MNNSPAKSGKIQRVNGKFPPGVSGNPAGKPKGTKHFNTLFNDLMKEKIKMPDGEEMTILRAMGLAMVKKAIRGSEHAFDSVADRLDGKPSFEIQMLEPPAPIMIIKNRPAQNVLGNNSNRQNSSSDQEN